MCVWGGGGGGVTLIFSYVRRLGLIFGVQYFEFQCFWGYSEKIQKNVYSFGYESFVDVFLGSSQNWAIFRGHFYAF